MCPLRFDFHKNKSLDNNNQQITIPSNKDLTQSKKVKAIADTYPPGTIANTPKTHKAPLEISNRPLTIENIPLRYNNNQELN